MKKSVLGCRKLRLVVLLMKKKPKGKNFFMPAILPEMINEEVKKYPKEHFAVDNSTSEHFQPKRISESNSIQPSIQPLKKKKLQEEPQSQIQMDQMEIYPSTKNLIDASQFLELLHPSKDSNDVFGLVKSIHVIKIYYYGEIKSTTKLTISYIAESTNGQAEFFLELPFTGSFCSVYLDLRDGQMFTEHLKSFERNVFKFIFRIESSNFFTPNFTLENIKTIDQLLSRDFVNTKASIEVLAILPNYAFSKGQFIKVYFTCCQEMLESLEPIFLLLDVNLTVWYFGVDKSMNTESYVAVVEIPTLQIHQTLQTEITFLNNNELVGKFPFEIGREINKCFLNFSPSVKEFNDSLPQIRKDFTESKNQKESITISTSLPSLSEMMSEIAPDNQLTFIEEEKIVEDPKVVENTQEVSVSTDPDIALFIEKLKSNAISNQKQFKPPYEDFEDSFVQGKQKNTQFLTNIVQTQFNEKNYGIRNAFLVGKYLLHRKEDYKKLNGGLNGWRSFISNIGIVQYDKVNEVINLYQYLGTYKKFQFVTDSIWRVQRLSPKIAQYLKSNPKENEFWLNW